MKRTLLVLSVGFAVVVIGLVILAIGMMLLPRAKSWLVGSPRGDVLLYEVEPESLTPGQTVDMEQLVKAIDRRLNPAWTALARVRPLDGDRIEVAVYLPGDEPREQVERLLDYVGTLEFRVLANERDHKSLIELAGQEDGPTVKDSEGQVLARWVPVAEGNAVITTVMPVARRTRKPGELAEVLVVVDPYHVTGQYLRSAMPSHDERGTPCVMFELTPQGGQLFGRLTGNNLPDPETGSSRQLGIILNGRLHSAPTIQSTIYDRGQITGQFTQQEVEEIVAVLNAGALPARVRKADPVKPRRSSSR